MQTTPKSEVTDFLRDGLGQETKRTNPLSFSWETDYNAVEQVVAGFLPDGGRNQKEYDPVDQPGRVIGSGLDN